MKRLIFIVSFIAVLFGLAWVLNELKPEPKNTDYFHESKPLIFNQ